MERTIKRVMIVDDDIGILDSMGMILKFEGYEVTSAVKGSEAFELISKNGPPDLILLDIWLSGEDGKDICRKLKQNGHTKNTPVIMISASPDLENSARQSGADDFIAKPFEMKDFLDKIKNMAP